MKQFVCFVAAVATVAGLVADMAPAPGQSDGEVAPIYGVKIPVGYRDWKLIAVDQLVTDKVDQLRAQLGNDIAIKAFKEGKIPFPDGTIIAALHWNHVPSEDNTKSWSVHSPALNLSSSGPRKCSVYGQGLKNTPRRAAGGSLTLRTENLATRHCTIPASPATRLRKIAIMSSPLTHLRTATAGRVA